MAEVCNYSIIIPHKNTPDLLKRCLESIPRKNDIQIIVVDDNSDKENVDFENFPGLDDCSIEVYFTKSNKGAGYARNVGLEHAKGRWLIFADADDYFTENFSLNVSKYILSDVDIVFFNVAFDKNIKYQGSNYNNVISNYNPDDINTILDIKYTIWAPWSKMYKREFITKSNIFFEEKPVGNDCYFVLNHNLIAKKIIVDKQVIYCNTFTAHSLSHGKLKFSIEIERLKLFVWRSKFYRKNNLDFYNKLGIYSQLKGMFQKFNFFYLIIAVFITIKNKADFLAPIKYFIKKKMK